MTTVVLLPGMDGSGLLFSDLVSFLGANSRVISYPNVAMDYSELTRFVRESLPVDQPFILVGESFSGPIAMSLAASRVAGLCGVVLVCTFARRPGPELLGLLGKLALSLPFWRVPIRFASFAVLGRFSSSALRARLRQALRSLTPVVWRSRLHSVLEVDATPLLSQITVPVLYLRASEDRVVSASASELILRHAPATKVIELEGPHFLLQAKPRKAAAAIQAFAQACGLRSNNALQATCEDARA